MLDRKSTAKLDSQNMLSSIEVLDKQCLDAWDSTKSMLFPQEYTDINRIVLFGMGGSALGIHIVKTVFEDQITVPIDIVSDYNIPAYVNKNTLAILSSYSGTTEEVVTISKEILNKTKKIFVFTTGGDLKHFAEEHNIPGYIFNPKHNPSKQPRMAVGYSVMGILGAFSALKLLELSDNEVQDMARYLAELNAQLGVDAPDDQNLTKQLARKIHGKIPVLVSSEFLKGSAHVFGNQINENGKHFSVRFPIPEMNHHVIEGFVHPREGLDRLIFIFITSQLYHKRNLQRHTITKTVVHKNNIQSETLQLRGKTKFEQALELLVYGSYTSLYVAILNNLDPSPIPNIDFLKEELQKD